MPPLPAELRRDLEKAVVSARRLAEAAGRAALARLGVGETDAPVALTAEQRGLRTALRERAKALGGGDRTVGIPLLVEEIAYEQWHRMLFARFLAENDLLLHPEGAPVSLAEVRELAAEEGERDPWALAARYAAAMLPGIFRADDPANRVAFAPEDRSRLEAVLEQLPASLFTADDALGWVYQFWQSERKDEVNKRGDKIGGADLPAVTQLFTEHYMVRFLLENSLGAWWAGWRDASPMLREWEYLRFRDDGTPAAGTFEGWPARVAEVTVMDPCCGSGHFLVGAGEMLRKMRMEEEGLTPAQAATAVIRDNLFGLELDARCLQLAAFNLALDAWKAGGYQLLPIPNLACSGIAINGQRADWHRLAGADTNMADALDRLYDLFQDAPELGSLIDPRSAAGEGLWAVDTDALLAKLDRALAKESATDPAAAVFGAAAAGTAKAAQLLAGRYWLVTTNPPFLQRASVSRGLGNYLDLRLGSSRHDLSTALLERSVGMCAAGGVEAFVTPQNWFFLTRYRVFRSKCLLNFPPRVVTVLGEHAFESTAAAGAFVALYIATGNASAAASALDGTVPGWGLDASSANTSMEKARRLHSADGVSISIAAALRDPDHRISLLERDENLPLLAEVANSYHGQGTRDSDRFMRDHWEFPTIGTGWIRMQTTVDATRDFGGASRLLLWEDGRGRLARWIADFAAAGSVSPDWNAGLQVWARPGVVVSQMRSLPVTLYLGHSFDSNAAVVAPLRPEHMPAVWAFCSSGVFAPLVRQIDKALKVTNATLVKVPFDLEHWTKVAAEQYPNGLPEPHSDDPTQWLFKGNVVGSDAPLQVAVARLLGYRWPEQEPDALDEFADADGLVPLVSVGGERPAAERLRALLAQAYGEGWSSALLERLLAEAGSPGATLETWLRDDFSAQHAKLFQQRPFIWQVWDGRKDGFSVLCHYHRLDRAKLEKLTYTLLRDWIERQRAAGDEPGTEARLAAALGLQKQLARIVEGEQPFDIYVRWKSLAVQPIGWEPDLDDGVRLNIRPFVAAGVLRGKVNVKWDKDRGKNPHGSERINDLHPTLAEKRAARATAGRQT